LALSYRLMKDRFLEQPKVKSVNEALAARKGGISDKVISVSLDTSSRASWEAGIMPRHLRAPKRSFEVFDTKPGSRRSNPGSSNSKRVHRKNASYKGRWAVSG